MKKILRFLRSLEKLLKVDRIFKQSTNFWSNFEEMKTLQEILKKVRKKCYIKKNCFGMHLKEFVEKLVRNFRKIKKEFLENFEKLRRQKLKILIKF